jgi:hypothetical protein
MDSGNSMAFENNLHGKTEIHESTDHSFNSENGPT